QARSGRSGDPTRWAEATAAVRRAEDLLQQGEAETALRRRVAEVRADLERERAGAEERARRAESDRKLLAELESIRGVRTEHWDAGRADASYAAVFRAAGLDADRLEPGEVGARVAQRTVAVELASYLDEWAFVRRNSLRPVDGASWRRLVEAVR